MKKSLIEGTLIAVIAIMTFIAQKEFMEIVNARAGEIYSAAVANATRATSRTNFQRISNTPQEKEFLNTWVKQKYRGDAFTEKTLSGTLLVLHEDTIGKNGAFVAQEGKDIHQLYLSTSTGMYQIENISYFASENLNNVEVSLTGFLSSKEKEGYKQLVVDIPEEKIKALKSKTANLPRDWKHASDNRDSSCVGNYCSLVILVDTTHNSAALPPAQEIEDYIFTSPGRIKSAFSEESYGQMDYGGDVTEWIETSEPVGIGLFPTEVNQYLTNNSINLTDYDQIMYLINADVSVANLGTVGSNNNSVPGTALAQMSFMYYASNSNLNSANNHLSLFDSIYIHETGHNLGALHDNALVCEHGLNSLPSECIHVEYGNQYSIMGGSSLGGHFSFLKKIIIGWLQMADLVTLNSPGNAQIRPIEESGAKAVAIDANSDSIPEYILEKRASVGLDSGGKKYKPDTAMVYTLADDELNVPGDLFTWDIGEKFNLRDLTPPTTSLNAVNSQNDATLNTPVISNNLNSSAEHIVDSLRGVKIGAVKNTFGGNVSFQAIPISNNCILKPIKLFRAGDDLGEQLPKQKWPQTPLVPPDPEDLPTIQVNNTNPNASIGMEIRYNVFNDDSASCDPAYYQAEIAFEGETIFTTEYDLDPWSGPNFVSSGVLVPVSGLPYGEHTINLQVTKLNDGSHVSYDLLFNLVPQ